jgi:aryl-alcohol dehydrogenase-like predicted oxidoreductase
MKYRDFGKTGITVSEVGFGAWAIGGNRHGNSYGATDDKTSLAAIDVAIGLGCNFFDTADVYGWGLSEELIGRAVKGKRDAIVIATKGGSDFYQGYGFQTFTPEYIRYALDKSLSRLQTDYIDVYQLHNPPLEVIESVETYEILQDLKKDGKIRAWGLSVFKASDGLVALNVCKPDCLQVPYNIFMKEPEIELFPKAAELGCAIIAREPLANGFLAGKYDLNPSFESGDMRRNWPKDYIHARVQAAAKLAFLERNGSRTLAQAAIRWVLDCSMVTVTIPGIKTPEQASENLASPSVAMISQEERCAVEELQTEQFGLA